MALSFLTTKVLRVEVTEGVDLESGVFLSGDRITVGTGRDDTLRLGSGDVVEEHLTLIRQSESKNWEYFTSDRGRTSVDRGNPRTGTLRAGMWFRLGNETRVDILRVPAPENMDASQTVEEKKEIPLAVALPVMGVLLAAFALYMTSLGSGQGNGGATLRTANWFVGTTPLEPALDICLATGIEQSLSMGAVKVARSAPDALFHEYILTEQTKTESAVEIRNNLSTQIKKSIAQAHLLVREGRFLDASDTLRRLENVLPTGNGNCPILSAARADLATLELRGRRR